MGVLIEFYRPAPKSPVPPAPEPPAICAADILREILGNSEQLSDVLVLMRDNDGTCGFVGNLDGAAETLLFMEQIKHEMLTRMRSDDDTPPIKIS